MSTLLFRDQNSNPVWGLATRISRGHGDTNKAEDERYPDRAGSTAFTGVKLVLPSDDGHTIHINYNEGLNPDWASYEPVSVHLLDIEAVPSGYTIVVRRKGSGGGTKLTTVHCPANPSIEGYGTPSEWKAIAHEIVNKLHLTFMDETGEGQNQLQRFNTALKEYHPLAELQHNTGDTVKRPRLMMPTADRSEGECGKWSRPVDFGDFGFPFFEGRGGQHDVWIMTGRTGEW